MSYKKIHEDNRHAVLQHKDGHQIKVAKGVLSRKMQSMLKGIPMQNMAEGGEVKDSEELQKEIDKMNIAKEHDNALDVMGVKSGKYGEQYVSPDSVSYRGLASEQAAPDHLPWYKLLTGMSPQLEAEAAKNPANAGMPLAGPSSLANPQAVQKIEEQNAPKTYEAYKVSDVRGPSAVPQQQPIMPSGLGDIMAGYGQQRKGLGMEAQALQQQAKDEQRAAQDYQAGLRAEKEIYDEKMNYYNKEIQSVQNDIKNGHINPNAYLNNMKTPQKIMSAIGLILGGIGQGLIGGENPAMKFIENQINNDVEAQKANMQNKNNVMTAYMNQMKNVQDATLMTKAFYTDLYANKMKEIASRTADPMAKARLMQEIGKLDIQKGTLLSQVAQSGAGMAMQDPTMRAIYTQVPKELRDNAVKEKGFVDKYNNAVNGVKDIYSQLGKIGVVAGNMPFSKTKARMESLNAVLISKAMSAVKGNPSEGEFKRQVSPFMIEPSDTKQQVNEKLNGMLEFLETNKEPTPILSSIGLAKAPLDVKKYGE